jgi:formylglycine-generating enzyme required for sulfatase activity
MSYFDYPAGSDTVTTCTVPGAVANTANCAGESDPPNGDLTDVGSYTGAASPVGTFDQGGNVYEWNEAILASGTSRGERGGNFTQGGTTALLGAESRNALFPTTEHPGVGFRVASPVPPVPSLSLGGLLVLAASLLGFPGYRQARA